MATWFEIMEAMVADATSSMRMPKAAKCPFGGNSCNHWAFPQFDRCKDCPLSNEGGNE
jgi:hypothetical protein